MTSSLESRLADELRHEAERVGELPGLAERVVARAHVVRRRRGLTAAAVSGVAVVVLFVAFVGGGLSHTSTLPPAHKTPHPSASATLSESLRQLPQGSPPDVDYVVGTKAHLGGRTYRLPSGWVVSRLLRAGDRWVVTAQVGDPEGREAVATVTKQGDVAVLDQGVAGGLAVDPSGRYVAWGSESSGTPSKHQLTEYDLTTSAVVARRTVARPASVVGWAKEGVIASYLVDPGGSPVVWDPQADTLTKVWGGSGGGPTFVAYSGAHHLWLLDDWVRGCDVVLSRVGGTAPGKHCTDRLMPDGLNGPVAFFAEGQLLAVASVSTHSVRIFDAQLADTGDAHPIPAGTVALQIVPTTGVHLLVRVMGISDRSPHVLGCLGNGPCERLLDGSLGEQLVLASP
jgi:hypothetical protein